MVADTQARFKKNSIMTTPQFYCSESLSALVDGELVMVSAESGLQEVFQPNTLHSDWNNYQVIGHSLREGEGTGAQLGADPAFLRRLNARLADEKMMPQVLFVPDLGAISQPDQPAANEDVFRWKLVAGFASLATALVVGWNFMGSPDASAGAQLAQNQTIEQVVVASPQGFIVRDARLEELMAAHKQLGGSSLQAPSGFLRNAGFENSQSSRR